MFFKKKKKADVNFEELYKKFKSKSEINKNINDTSIIIWYTLAAICLMSGIPAKTLAKTIMQPNFIIEFIKQFNQAIAEEAENLQSDLGLN